LIPYEKVTVTTPLSPEALIERLAEIVAPYQWFPTFREKPFHGEVERCAFKIQPLGLTYRPLARQPDQPDIVLHRPLSRKKGFHPVIVGRVEIDKKGQTVVNLTFRLHMMMLAILGTLGSLLVVLNLRMLYGLVELLQTQPDATSDDLWRMAGLPAISLLLGVFFLYPMVTGSFRMVSHRTKAMLARHLQLDFGELPDINREMLLYWMLLAFFFVICCAAFGLMLYYGLI
jgi:hypothetical protein